VYRLSAPAHDEVRVRTRCHHCQHPFPTGPAGWLPPRNRCRHCHQSLGPPTAATITATTATCALITLRLPDSPLLPALLASAIAGLAAALVDLRCRRLPDLLVLPTAALCALAITITGIAQADPLHVARAFAGSAALATTLLILAVTTGGYGMGDVKAIAWTGLLAGWQGPTALLIAAAGPFVIQAPIALALLATKRVGRHSTLAFGPALLAAGLLAITVAA